MNIIVEISKGEAKTLSNIMSLIKQGMNSPSYNDLAKLTGYNIRTVRHQVNSLCEKGLIIKYQAKLNNGRNAPNTYFLCKELQRLW